VQEALRQGVTAVDIYLRVLQDSQYRVGELWESNRITVAQEHMATGITQYVVSMLYGHLVMSPEKRGRIVLTGLPGELHQVGGMMAADVLEADGWDVRFLGTNMPMRDIVTSVREHDAHVLAVSATMSFNIPAVKELIAACRQVENGRRLHVIVGGGAWRHAPMAHTEIGAESYAAGILHGREQLRALRFV
jgi:methanogenic corrinoid protein MtbC1